MHCAYLSPMAAFLRSGWFIGLLTGLIGWLAWPPFPFPILIWVFLIPLMWYEDQIYQQKSSRSRLKVFGTSFLGFVIWNALTTWWIWLASPAGAMGAIAANAAFQALMFLFFHVTRVQTGNAVGYLSLFVYWIAWEYVHHTWELAWPWLSLGNSLASMPSLAQWYEWTGVMGGSLWVLGINVLLFRVIKLHHTLWQKRKENPEDRDLVQFQKIRAWVSGVKLFGVLVLPIIVSFVLMARFTPSEETVEAVAVQPNINPHYEKFPGTDRFIPYPEQMQRLLEGSRDKVTDQTKILAWPETAIPGGMDVADLEGYEQVKLIRRLLRENPQMALVTGIDGYEMYGAEPATPTARLTTNGNYYDAFNTAIWLGERVNTVWYHKSKLVPGVERMPYPGLFSFLENFAINLGGISGSLGMQGHRSVFFTHDSVGVAPIICFESVFGDYVTEYVSNGATILAIITNDGWWGNTAGHKQHLEYASLRAIETRRSIIRAANTGISCFVDPLGRIYQQTNYNEQASIRRDVSIETGTTLYVKYGDVLGRVCAMLAVLLLLLTFVSGRTNRFFYRANKIRK